MLTRLLWGVAAAGLALFAVAVSPAMTSAQSEPPSQSWPADVSADEVNEVAKELWCPLCSGVRLDSCELKACDQMKEVIAIKLSEGESTDAIKAYFLDQYGPQVLGEPPREGFNWLAWILPFVALIGGAVFLWFRTRNMIRPAPQGAVDTDSVDSRTAEKDEYERKLEEELEQYG